MKFNHEKHRHDCWNNSWWTSCFNQEWVTQLKDIGWHESLDDAAGTISFDFDMRVASKSGNVRRTKFITVKFDRNGNGPVVEMSATITEETKAIFMVRYAELIALLSNFGLLDYQTR